MAYQFKMPSARDMYLAKSQISHQVVPLTCEQAINTLPEPLRSQLMGIWASPSKGGVTYELLMQLALELDRMQYPNAHFIAKCFRGVAARMGTWNFTIGLG